MSVEGYELRSVGQHTVLTLPAEMDVTNAGEVRQALQAAAGHGMRTLIIDMSGTTFCDSTGVQAIITTYQQAAAAGTELRLVAPAALRILTVIGVDQLIPIYPDLEAALSAGG